MRVTDLEELRCPNCRSADLTIQDPANDDQGDLESGQIVCGECARAMKIDGGILLALPLGSETDSTQEIDSKNKEREARDAQAGDYDRMLGLKLFGSIEIPMTLRMVHPDVSKTLVEVGCGTGRMTDAFAERSQRVIALDFSLESVRRCQAKMKKRGIRNVVFIQADATALPLADAIGEKVVSCQVLEHVPTAEARERMIGELARIVKPGGDVMVSAYKHSLLTKLFAKKEGEHEGGIYYYRFARAELKELLNKKLDVRSMTGALVYHYMVKASRLN